MADIICGNVGKCEEKQTKTGKPFINFSVAENKGFGDSKETTWYECTSWDSVNLNKGDKVVVIGHKGTRVYQDKTYNTFEVFRVERLGDMF